jgi:hypothetical protein
VKARVWEQYARRETSLYQILRALGLALFEATILEELQQFDCQDDLPFFLHRLNLFILEPEYGMFTPISIETPRDVFCR